MKVVRTGTATKKRCKAAGGLSGEAVVTNT